MMLTICVYLCVCVPVCVVCEITTYEFSSYIYNVCVVL